MLEDLKRRLKENIFSVFTQWNNVSGVSGITIDTDKDTNENTKECVLSVRWLRGRSINPEIDFKDIVIFQLKNKWFRKTSHVLSVFSHSVWLSAAQLTAAHQAFLSFTVSWSLPKFMCTESRCHPDISSSVAPFSFCPQSFPSSRSFRMSWPFASRGQSFGVSASVLPMNIQAWFPLGLTDLIYLLLKRLSNVFSTTIVQKHQFFDAQLASWSNFHFHTQLLEKP